VYDMPLHLRRFYLDKLADQKKKETESIKKESRAKPPTKK